MKCTICEGDMTEGEDHSCKDELLGRYEGRLDEVWGQWAMSRLLKIDDRLDLLKEQVLKQEKEIRKLENYKFLLLREMQSSGEISGGGEK